MATAKAPNTWDIAIVGGGMVGASLACLLARSQPRWRVVLLESQPIRRSQYQSSFDNRSTALARGSLDLLARAGLWPELAAHATPIQRVHVSDRGHPAGHLIEDGEPLGQVVENPWLGQVLLRQLQASGVEYLAPVTVQALLPRRDSAQLSLADGRTLHTRLAVIANGDRSPLGRTLGMDATVTDYHQTALVANVRFSEPHGGTAYERFTAAGPLALLPLGQNADSRRAALIWTHDTNTAPRWLAAPEPEFLAGLQDSFGWRLGRFERVGSCQAFPLRLVSANEQVRSRLLLAGNAAHFLHPVAGQGFNLSLRDCACLTDTLAEAARSGCDPGELSVLEDYLARRRGDQWLTSGFSDSLTRLFSRRDPGAVLLRQLGLLTLDLLPPAGRLLAAQTMGTATWQSGARP